MSTRRELIQVTAGAMIAATGEASAQNGGQFFTLDEFRMVDELTEIIIPADEHSPGARAAKVAAYVDARLAESLEPEPKELWRDGLKRVDALAREMHGRSFLEAAPGERVAVVARMAEHEADPKTPAELFFREIKSRTAHAYYTSEIGIHREMEYKGNTILQEFVGYEVK
jgi:gluconate 2-dehydrogenase gamma chain